MRFQEGVVEVWVGGKLWRPRCVDSQAGGSDPGIMSLI